MSQLARHRPHLRCARWRLPRYFPRRQDRRCGRRRHPTHLRRHPLPQTIRRVTPRMRIARKRVRRLRSRVVTNCRLSHSRRPPHLDAPHRYMTHRQNPAHPFHFRVSRSHSLHRRSRHRFQSDSSSRRPKRPLHLLRRRWLSDRQKRNSLRSFPSGLIPHRPGQR